MWLSRHKPRHSPQPLAVPYRPCDRRRDRPAEAGQVPQYRRFVRKILFGVQHVVAPEYENLVVVPDQPVAVADGVRVGRSGWLEPVDPDPEFGGDGVQVVGGDRGHRVIKPGARRSGLKTKT